MISFLRLRVASMLAPDRSRDIDWAALTDEVLARCAIVAGYSEENGNITRTFLCEPMRRLHNLMTTWMHAARLSVRRDAIGNLIGQWMMRRRGPSAFDNWDTGLTPNVRTDFVAPYREPAPDPIATVIIESSQPDSEVLIDAKPRGFAWWCSTGPCRACPVSACLPSW